jgi:hypothetical protein
VTSRAAAIALAGALLVTACSTSGPAPTAAPSGPVEVTSTTKGELQTVLGAQVAALGKRDLKAYQATFDGGRAAFRRCKQESFDVAGRQGAPSRPPQVVKVETYGDAYVRAWVDQGPSSGVARIYFRKVDGAWVQSEPTDTEVGAEKHTTVDGIDIDYWGIDDDVIDALGNGTLAARDAVLKAELTPSSHPFGIRFYPTASVTTLVGCNIVGFHLTNQPNDKYIRFFRYWFTPDLSALSAPTISFIEHEGLHWAQDQFSAGITARLDWWLTEGWPDFIGASRSTGEKRSVLCGTPTPTFKQLVDGPPDLPDTPPEDAVRYYSFANTMVEYLYARFGPDAYRQLLIAYKAGVDPKVNYPLVLKTTPDEFYADWLTFAKKKYC